MFNPYTTNYAEAASVSVILVFFKDQYLNMMHDKLFVTFSIERTKQIDQ